jgi:type III restriction enzyme
MAKMKFKFTIQDYQTSAVDSVVKVFAGQPFQDKVSYRRDTGTQELTMSLTGSCLMKNSIWGLPMRRWR